ncbi:MAG TPA: DMT family transporter [Flavipsychrobacter sp.]|nr:DMT family transporter [Flavipsychrobacter sp.]
MFYLLAVILLNTLLYAFFKVFPKYKVDTFQAIVANYWTCVATGSIFLGYFPVNGGSISEPWLPWAMLMGAGFISIFNLVGYCTRIDGITTATIANKLSLVIPVLFSVFLYSEHLTSIKLLGILLAFPAVYLTTRVKGEEGKMQSLFWPALLFLGSGLLDTLVKFVEQAYLDTQQVQAEYTIHVFSTAAIIGTVLVSFLAVTKKTRLHPRNIIAGILLGIPNFFSIYYLIRLLNSDYMQSSAAIPISNIGVVIASSISAILIFKESANRQRIVGLLLAIMAILLISLGDIYGGSN